MGIADFSAKRSKDPNTQVGACAVDATHRIVSIGYNGMPNRINDDEITWERDGNPLDTKYMYVCHAEENTIMNAPRKDLSDCTMYVTLFPCHNCAKLIIQSGVTHIIYKEDKYHDTESSIAARKLFDMAQVTYEPYRVTDRIVELQL